jgi:sugar lactone lactonase YvrE
MNIKFERMAAAAPLAALLLLLTACNSSSSNQIIAGPTPPPVTGSMYLTDSSIDTGVLIDQVLVFPQNANGGPAPTQDITGNVTGLSVPQGIAVDRAGNIWVTNFNTSSITEYNAGATGNVAPINTVQGSSTFLAGPIGIAFDSAGDVFVVNSQLDSSGLFELLEFGPNPTGNQGPIRRIGGSATLLNNPQYVAVDGAGNAYVTNIANNLITIFGPGASGNVAPLVSFSGNCAQPDGIALDGAKNIYVACDQNYEVREYSALSGSGTPTQIRSLGVGATQPQLYNPSGLAVNSLGTLFVSNSGLQGQALGYITAYTPSFSNTTGPGALLGGGSSNIIRPGGIALH